MSNNKNQEIAEITPFLLMDKEDEKQIIAEMRGEILKTYVYSYTDKGRKVTGLSKAGIDAAVKEAGAHGEAMRILDKQVYRDEDCYEVIVTAGRFVVDKSGSGKEILLDTTLGAKRQMKKYPNGKINPFAFEQAVVKAERNAKRKLLPEKLISELIKEYIKKGKSEELKKGEENSIDQVKVPEKKSEEKSKEEVRKVKSKEDDASEGEIVIIRELAQQLGIKKWRGIPLKSILDKGISKEKAKTMINFFKGLTKKREIKNNKEYAKPYGEK